MLESEWVIKIINEIRGESGLDPLLVPIDEEEVENVVPLTIDFTYEFPEDLLEENKESTLQALVGDLMKPGESLAGGLSSALTHVSVSVEPEGNHTLAVIKFYHKHLNMDSPGPVINGDLVVQGTCMSSSHAPALCKVSTAADDVEEYTLAATVQPWQMMYTPAEGDEMPASFAIPVSIDKDFSGSVKIEIFTAAVGKVSFDIPDDEEVAPTVAEDDLVATVDVTVRTSAGGEGEAAIDEQDVTAAMAAAGAPTRVVTGLAVAMSADEVEALTGTGYEVCEPINDSSKAAGDSVLKDFTLCATYGQVDGNEMGAVEDAMWVTTTEDAPEGYTVVSGNLSVAGGEVALAPDAETKADAEGDAEADPEGESARACRSIFLAIKIGPIGAFTQVSIVRFAAEARVVLEERLNSLGTTEFREVAASEGGPCVAGIALVVNRTVVPTEGSADEAPATAVATAVEGMEDDVPETVGLEDDNMSRITQEDAIALEENNGADMMDLDGMGDSDSYMKEDVNAAREVDNLRNILLQLEEDLAISRKKNAEAQKKVSSLMAKQSQQTSQAMNSRGMTPTTANQTDDGEESAAVLENNAEKEKHFNDTLKLISQARVRLHKQQAEFDQLVVDLQARLDDKEFRAMEIADTFKEFKREILAKAEHSRTNKPLSKRVIKEFEEAEQLKDGELERVRLRNISLRTGLRKVERALKAKEQLAEGLHMIDFEQLKIENQTLNEKIEERNEELSKLKRKKTATVQVLTHIREKLRFVQKEIEGVREVMANVDGDINMQRALLATLKKDRDFYKSENTELRRLQGFATSDLLLDDFEDRKGALESAKANIRELKERHAMLTKQIANNEKMTASNMRGKSGLTLPHINK